MREVTVNLVALNMVGLIVIAGKLHLRQEEMYFTSQVAAKALIFKSMKQKPASLHEQ